MAAMKREGKTLAVLPDGAKRRLADMKNGWRKASPEQRIEFMSWIGLGFIRVTGSEMKLVSERWEAPQQ